MTGFEGTITTRAEYLTGPPRVMLEALHDGKVVDFWCDEERVEHAATRHEAYGVDPMPDRERGR